MCASTGNRYLDIGLGVALGAVTAGAGFGVTAASATLLIRRYRKRGSRELEQ